MLGGLFTHNSGAIAQMPIALSDHTIAGPCPQLCVLGQDDHPGQLQRAQIQLQQIPVELGAHVTQPARGNLERGRRLHPRRQHCRHRRVVHIRVMASGDVVEIVVVHHQQDYRVRARGQ